MATKTLKVSDKQIMASITSRIGNRKRFFSLNKKGYPIGNGIEVVNKTCKLKAYHNLATGELTKVFILSLADGRQVRYTVEIKGKSKSKRKPMDHRGFRHEVPGRSS